MWPDTFCAGPLQVTKVAFCLLPFLSQLLRNSSQEEKCYLGSPLGNTKINSVILMSHLGKLSELNLCLTLYFIPRTWITWAPSTEPSPVCLLHILPSVRNRYLSFDIVRLVNVSVLFFIHNYFFMLCLGRCSRSWKRIQQLQCNDYIDRQCAKMLFPSLSIRYHRPDTNQCAVIREFRSSGFSITVLCCFLKIMPI